MVYFYSDREKLIGENRERENYFLVNDKKKCVHSPGLIQERDILQTYIYIQRCNMCLFSRFRRNQREKNWRKKNQEGEIFSY